MLEQKTSFNQLQRIEIIYSMFSDMSGIKQEAKKKDTLKTFNCLVIKQCISD